MIGKCIFQGAFTDRQLKPCVSTSLKVSRLNPHRINQTDGRPLLQYYAMAAFTILVYDHFLTLGDEVSQVFPVSIL